MAHEHYIYDDDKRFVIDPVNRVVKTSGTERPVLMQYDHNSEHITFECDRIVENHDFSLCDKVEIHYINGNGRQITKGVYPVEDLAVVYNDDSKIKFTWIVSQNATMYPGVLSFVIAFTCTDEGDILYRWNTAVNSDLVISSGINNGEAIEQSYADILEMWRLDLFGIADTEEARIKAMGDRVIDSIPTEYTELTSDIFQSSLFVRNAEHLDDLNNAVSNRVYTISLTDEATVLNMPGDERHGTLLTFKTKNISGGHVQIFVNDGGSKMYFRSNWGNSVWRAWKEIADADAIKHMFAAASGLISSEANLDDLNNAENNRAYAISLSDTANVLNMPGDERHGSLLTFCRQTTDDTGAVQLFISNKGVSYVRICWGANATWSEWKRYSVYGEEPVIENIPLAVVNDTPGLLSCFLNVGCIGDSLASGESVYIQEDGSNGYADLYQHSWGQYLARMTGNKYYNWSSGGRTCETWLTSSYATECFDGNHKCEAYIIGLGQNDYNRGYTLGSSYDINVSDYNNNAASFFGNYGKIISKIKEIQPKAKIFILTDPSSGTEDGGYNEAIRTIATMFDNVYLVDLYTYGYSLYTSGLIGECRRVGHFNAMAYREMSLIIASYIDWIMRNNISEFSEIEFISTDYSYND